MSTINTILDRIEFLACENMTLRKSNESLNHEINKLHDSRDDQNYIIQSQKNQIQELNDQIVLLGDLLNKFHSQRGIAPDVYHESIAKEICKKYNNSPSDRIKMIRDFRNATKSSLLEAKDMIDSIVPRP